MDFSSLHEIESVRLISHEPRPYSDLSDCLSRFGFARHDDVFSLDRTDAPLPWQHSAVIEARTLINGEEVYEDVWDTVSLDYLFAFLPADYIDLYVETIFRVADCLELAPIFRDAPVDRIQLRAKLQSFVVELASEYGERPGSESLAVLIAETYPRKRLL